jgi:hypothetical protein
MSQYLRRLVLVAFSSALLPYALIPAASAQSVAPDTSGGAPQDWSHKHLIYANPDTRDEAARKGTLAFEEWKQKYKDPRFAQQVARKQRFVQASDHSPFSPQQLQWFKRHDRNPPAAGPKVHRDWSNVLGGVSGVGRAAVFPAKYGPSFTTADCAQDFVVYPTASAGATSTGTPTTWSGTLSGQPTAGQTLTITRAGSPDLILTATNATTGLNSGLNFQIGTSFAVTATNLAAAIARNGGTAGVTATNPSNNFVTISSLATGPTPNITIATTLANITGIAITAGTGAAGQPTIVGFNQLYSSCGTIPLLPAPQTQAVPATFWSYNTGNGTLIQTSPVLSIDGTQIAFVQGTGTAGTTATLVLLKWSSTVPVGTVGVPTAPTSVTPANYRACTAPCMSTLVLSGTPANTNSSPYYDYANDILYVGADNGTLHKFTGVFNGTPAEAGAGTPTWPITVSSGNILTSPVYDSGTGLVFVGSKAGAATGGRLHSVNATSGAVLSSGQLALFNTVGVRDAPIVDSTAKKVYTFVGSDLTNKSAVYQFSTASSISGLTSPVAKVGLAVATSVLYSGGFDNTYWASTPASPTGNLYVCGSINATSLRPTLWKVPIANNAMGTPVVGPTLVGANAVCSPITEVMNGANDYIYASVTAGGNQAGCTGACIYAYNLTGLTWGTAAVPAAGLAATGGTSGIIVDNISATAGASQIYYSTIGTGTIGNAVQASQAALQ